MRLSKLARRVAAPLRDFLASLTVFTLIAATGISAPEPAGTPWIAGPAHARGMEAGPADPGFEPQLLASRRQAVEAGHRHIPALISLALAFATIMAFNLWLARHLRRVYAATRRRADR